MLEAPTPLARQFHEQHKAARGRIVSAGKFFEEERRASAWRAERAALLKALPIAFERKAPAPFPGGAVKFIFSAVAARFHTTLAELTSARRPQCLVIPRQIAAYLSVVLTPHSLPEIGRVAKRDHTTIIHAQRRVQRRLRTDPKFAQVVAELESSCRKALGQGSTQETDNV